MEKTTFFNKFKYIILLILAGEAVFILPFVLVRIFRGTVLEVYEITNVELGYCFSIYGIVALFSYVLGGPIADKYAPHKLMSTALILTGVGGILYAQIPSLLVLKMLYGYWGFTTIFLFWSPMVKATRLWGGSTQQGRAFGFLDGGRGLVASSFGVIGVLVFSLFVKNDTEALDPIAQKEAFQTIVYVSSTLVIIIGILIFKFLKLPHSESVITQKAITISDIKKVLKLPSVWLLMAIIVCAYVGYKITDIFSLYAEDIMKYSEIDAARTGTALLLMRPIVGVAIGFWADKSQPVKILSIGFLLSIVGGLLFTSNIIQPDTFFLFFIGIIITATGVYSTRVLYFAVLKECNIPITLTGTAVGIASFVGYTPDIFAGPLIGHYIDTMPGRAGHQAVFLLLVLFSAVGFIASVILYRMGKNMNK